MRRLVRALKELLEQIAISAMYFNALKTGRRFRVPAHVEVEWVLDGVESAYARFDVTAIEYNVAG